MCAAVATDQEEEQAASTIVPAERVVASAEAAAASPEAAAAAHAEPPVVVAHRFRFRSGPRAWHQAPSWAYFRRRYRSESREASLNPEPSAPRGISDAHPTTLYCLRSRRQGLERTSAAARRQLEVDGSGLLGSQAQRSKLEAAGGRVGCQSRACIWCELVRVWCKRVCVSLALWNVLYLELFSTC